MAPTAIFLFDTTGYAAKPFTDKGWTTYIIDTLNVGERAINPYATYTLDWNILKKESDIISLAFQAKFIFGFPPCTDLAVSGSKHFVKKVEINPNFQQEAVYLARSVERIGIKANIPWAFENPISRLSTLYRKPDFIFDPYQYGQYLPEDDIHPDYPNYINARDAYPKTTCLWAGNGFKFPKKKPVKITKGYSTQHKKLGGKSLKTKLIRSASPRGFFIALAELMEKEA